MPDRGRDGMDAGSCVAEARAAFPRPERPRSGGRAASRSERSGEDLVRRWNTGLLINFGSDRTFSLDYAGQLDTRPAVRGTVRIKGDTTCFTIGGGDSCSFGDEWASRGESSREGAAARRVREGGLWQLQGRTRDRMDAHPAIPQLPDPNSGCCRRHGRLTTSGTPSTFPFTNWRRRFPGHHLVRSSLTGTSSGLEGPVREPLRGAAGACREPTHTLEWYR